jgi:DNA-binding transcriptional ArsR family regulator
MPNKRALTSRQAKATIFAALGDETRLLLLARLSSGQQYSIADLTQGSTLTRQAITKHLRVLEKVKIVHGVKSGRENLFEFDPRPLLQAKDYLDQVSEQWDQTLGRLISFVEKE